MDPTACVNCIPVRYGIPMAMYELFGSVVTLAAVGYPYSGPIFHHRVARGSHHVSLQQLQKIQNFDPRAFGSGIELGSVLGWF